MLPGTGANGRTCPVRGMTQCQREGPVKSLVADKSETTI